MVTPWVRARFLLMSMLWSFLTPDSVVYIITIVIVVKMEGWSIGRWIVWLLCWVPPVLAIVSITVRSDSLFGVAYYGSFVGLPAIIYYIVKYVDVSK